MVAFPPCALLFGEMKKKNLINDDSPAVEVCGDNELVIITSILLSLGFGTLGVIGYYRYWLLPAATRTASMRRNRHITANSVPIRMICEKKSGAFRKWLSQQDDLLPLQALLDLAMNATYRGNAEALGLLLEHRVAENNGKMLCESFGEGGWNTNPLFVAIKRGNVDCVKILLEKGTPIELAVCWSRSSSSSPMISKDGEERKGTKSQQNSTQQSGQYYSIIDSMEQSNQLTGSVKKLVQRYRKKRRQELSIKLKKYGLNRKELDPIAIHIAEYIGV
mmetsp:Transcript_5366/g.8459  ORF Transcript_5366/g.8459 Transcript_5366/m.8459 type:complete len:277 (-) Transcript_5366:141-971(-)